MEWTEPVGAVAGVIGTLFGFLQWREARTAKADSKQLTDQLQQITNNTNSLPLLHDMLKELKLLGVKFPEDKAINGKVTLFEQELAKFEENLKYNQDAARWLEKKNTRLHLSKNAGDEALRVCSLKLSDPERKEFYKDIYKYLSWVFYTLYYGVPMPVELISPSLQEKKAYKEAFKYIIKTVPKDLYVDADRRVKGLIDSLISDFS